ncbi:MAG: hypothetical protein ABSF91_05440 [Bacteroidota bacterium]|jgi:hypothetical protein
MFDLIRYEKGITTTRAGVTEVPSDSLIFRIHDLKKKVWAIWENTPFQDPCLEEFYTAEEQKKHENELDTLIERARSEIQAWNGAEQVGLERIRELVVPFIAGSSHTTHRRLPVDILDSYFSSAVEFVGQAMRFDAQLSQDELYQALRNVLIVNSIQTYLGKKAALTPSAFAYSLLYPYTDNLLDDKSLSRVDKQHFLSTVEELLLAEKVHVTSSRSKKIQLLLTYIETEFPRTSNTRVHESLLAIHRAQRQSLEQQQGGTSPNTCDTLGVSMEKGGTSVLADAYLTAGDLSDDVAEFMFGYGVALQFIDDLQDLEQDHRNAHGTIFSEHIGHRSIQEITNRLFNFTQQILCAKDLFPSADAGSLSDFSLLCCRVLMFEAVARAEQFFTDSYLSGLEPHCPFGFDYLRSVQKKLEAISEHLIGQRLPARAAL